MKNCLSLLLLLALFMPASVMAGEEPDTPASVVSAFHAALASGEKERVLELLDPDVLIFESGGAELSRGEYASHHLNADMEFSAATTRTIVDQQVSEVAGAAWTLTRSETRGMFREKEVDVLGVETVVLRHGDRGWRIVHFHWSSRARAASH